MLSEAYLVLEIIYVLMTKMSNKKTLFGAILATITFSVIVSYLLTDTTQDAQAVQSPVQTISGITFDVDTADSYLAKGGKSIVKVEFPVKELKLIRGVTTAIDLHVKHVAGANPFPLVNVKVVPPNGYIWYPASMASLTTADQRIHAAETGILIPGSVDLGKIVTFSEANSVAIAAGNEHVVKMYITMPKDLPDDVIGHGAFLNVPIQAEDSNGNSDTVFAESAGINFQVVG